jgi:hypothetical protein
MVKAVQAVIDAAATPGVLEHILAKTHEETPQQGFTTW